MMRRPFCKAPVWPTGGVVDLRMWEDAGHSICQQVAAWDNECGSLGALNLCSALGVQHSFFPPTPQCWHSVWDCLSWGVRLASSGEWALLVPGCWLSCLLSPLVTTRGWWYGVEGIQELLSGLEDSVGLSWMFFRGAGVAGSWAQCITEGPCGAQDTSGNWGNPYRDRHPYQLFWCGYALQRPLDLTDYHSARFQYWTPIPPWVRPVLSLFVNKRKKTLHLINPLQFLQYI